MTGTRFTKKSHEPEEENAVGEDPEENRKPTAVDKAKGKARGKVKGKGKFKVQVRVEAKTKSRVAPVEEEEEGGGEKDLAPTAKAKAKQNFRERILQDIGDHNVTIDEVIEEARAEVQRCEKSIAETESMEKELRNQADAIQKNKEAIFAMVEEAKHKETEALEKWKAARMQKLKCGKAKMQDDLAEAAKGVSILQSELVARAKRKELEDLKTAAREAAEAARKALDDSKQKEKEIQEALKVVSVEQCEKEVEKMKAFAAETAEEKEAKKKKRAQDKQATINMQAEMTQIEKSRLEREKLRLKRRREAVGLGKGGSSWGRGLKRLMPPLVVEVQTTPSKAAHVGDAN